ncbi:RHS repeat-associated core domain-containing protein, partial [Thauera sinica]
PRVARNQAGQVVWRWESDAFGSTAANEDPAGTGTSTTVNLRFPGQYFDKESGLFYNLNRYYDPTIGRYISPDPIGLAGGLNSFGYASQNPLSFTDPDGLQATAVLGGFGGGSSVAGAGATAGLGASAAVAGAGLAGYGLGTLLYPYVEPAISKAVDWCMSTSADREQKCWAAYQAQIRICKMSPTAAARKQCYARAADIYGDCLRGKN